MSRRLQFKSKCIASHRTSSALYVLLTKIEGDHRYEKLKFQIQLVAFFRSKDDNNHRLRIHISKHLYRFEAMWI